MASERSDAFKVGFLRGLAAQGITPGEFVEALHKYAASDFGDPMELLSKFVGGTASAGQSALGTGIDTAVGGAKALAQGAIAAPVALGGLAGIISEKLESPDPSAIEDLQKAELIGLYRRLAGELRTRQQAKARMG